MVYLLSRLFVIFLTILSLSPWAMGQEQTTLMMESNRPIFVEIQKPERVAYPSFLLLPGVNRSWRSPDPFLKALKEAGYGYVSMSFSIQPFSLATLAKGETAYFEKNKDFNINNLIEEVVFVEDYFSQFFSTHLIPVTLSYSGLLGSQLPFPVVLNIAPLTSTAAGYPAFENQRKTLISAELFNPIFGPIFTRQTLDNSYRIYWAEKIDLLSREFNLSTSKRSQMIEGQTLLSRLAEGLEWQQPKKNSTHIFFIGGEESVSLLKHQLETIAELIENKQKILTYFIPNAGHVIPADQPHILLQALKQLTQAAEQTPSPKSKAEICLIVTVDQSPLTWKGLSCEQALNWIKDLASKI